MALRADGVEHRGQQVVGAERLAQEPASPFPSNPLVASWAANPLISTTLTSGRWARIRRYASDPPTRGILRSSRTSTKAFGALENASTPSCPSTATVTANPDSSSWRSLDVPEVVPHW